MRKACKKQPLECGYNPSDEIYEPLKLMQSVIMKTNDVCLRYLENSTLCTLPSPGPPYFITTACAVRNCRRRMEDRHVIIHDLNTIFNQTEASPSSYYAIFDGHAGHDAAAYSAAHLHQYLAESKHFVYNPEQALIDAFCKTDALFVEKCKVEGFGGGTTAVCALLRPKEKSLYIAWVGDSQALLANQGRILQCVNSHKPSREDEKYRIENQGGVVLFFLGIWRVNGQLAVSRAIGDAECKPYVIAVPEVREIPLSGTEDFLIIACDGLWDFLSEEDAASAVYSMVCDNPEDTDRISQHLVQLSKEQGSDDNISVIVVFLREPSKIASESRWAASTRSGAATMDAGLDNAATNNPFTHSDGDMFAQMDGFLQKIVDGGGYKTNGADPFYVERTNGKRGADEFGDEDMGPETDVDALDEVMEKMDVDQKHETELMDKAPREETPTPTVDEVLEAGLVDNVAESGEDSEDEWNYYRPEKENAQRTSQPDQEVAAITGSVEDVEEVEEEEEEDGSMSQLNPDAAEFVPISPTRSVDSPAWRALKEESVISQSPRRVPNEAITADINLPNEKDFELEVKNRPSECISNGHDNGHKISSLELMENLLNGKNIEDIEFQPNSTPVKPSEDFHFGPNATPFSTPSRISEALSTKANFGDESTASYLDGKILDSSFDKDISNFNFKKELDPMSMSFYAEKDEGNPFDLNKVQVLPENLDEFLSKPDEDITDQGSFNETISDLPEHDPICKRETDLLGVCELPKSPNKTPEPTMNENLCESPYEVSAHSPQLIKPEEEICEIKGEAGDVCALSPEPLKDSSEDNHDLIESASPEIPAKTPEATSVDLVSIGSPEPLEEISAKSPELCEVVDVHKDAKSPDSVLEDEGIQSPELVDESVIETPELLVCSKPPQVELAKSPVPEIAMSPEPVICENNAKELQESICNKSPEPQILDDLVCSKYSEETESEKDAVHESPETLQAKSPQPDFEKQDVENVTEDLKSNIIPLDAAEDICTKSSELLEGSVEEEIKQSPAIDSKSPEPPLESCKSPKLEEDVQQTVDVSCSLENLSKSPEPSEEIEKSTETMQMLTKSPEPVECSIKSAEPLMEVSKSPELYEEEATSAEPMEATPNSTEIMAKSPEPSEEVAVSPKPAEEFVESPEVEEIARSPEPIIESAKSPEPVVETVRSPEPIEEVAKSPEPAEEVVKSPEPVEEVAKSPEPVELAKSPEPVEEMVKSPEPTEEIAKSPEPIEEIAKSPEPLEQCTNVQEVECVYKPTVETKTPEPSIVESPIPVEALNAKSPEPVMEATETVLDVVATSPEPISDEIVKHTEPEAEDLICTKDVKAPTEDFGEKNKFEMETNDTKVDEMKSPLEEPKSLSEDIHSLIEDDVKLEEPASDKLSPLEDITSSVKDDEILSPVESCNLNYAQQLSSAVQENISSEISSPLENKEVDKMEETQADKELLLELHSVEPKMCVYPLKTRQINENEEVVKSSTDEASPQEVDTKSEVAEAKTDISGTPEVIVTPTAETSSDVKPIVDEDLSKESSVVPEVAAIAAVAAVGAAAATTAALKEEKKPALKPKTTTTTKKPASKPLAAKSPSKPTPPTTAKATPRTPPSKAATSPTTPKSATPSAARTPLSKTLAPRTPKASPAPSTAKPSPKPRTAPSATAKPADKKPLTNGDVKKAAVPPIKKPTTTAAPLSKTTAPKPLSAAKPAAAKPPSAARAAPSAAKPTSARSTTTTAAKPRPTSLTTKTTSTTTKSTLGAKPATSPSATKTAPAAKPKPASTTAPLKPRVPLTKPAAKAPDTEKQNKENVNKLTASRNSTTTTKTASGTAKTTTTVRKTEIKGVANSRTTTTKTTTTTLKGSSTLAAKKPIGDTKTKVTKVSKPKENGVTTVTEITTTTTMNEMDPQLLKDLSPIENMIIDNSQLADNGIAD